MLKRIVRKIEHGFRLDPADEFEFSNIAGKLAPAASKADAGKKLETNAFQIECETEAQWKALLKRDGLIVVDVYSSWAGPCVSMINTLKKLKAEINDERLWYAVAQSDDISELNMFHDQSEPTWLFMAGGETVRLFRGTHVPQLTALIKSEFCQEIQCLEGKAQRSVISIVDEVTRRRKAEAAAESLMKYIKEGDDPAEELNTVRRDSSVRLMHTLEPFTVLVVQNYLLETGALTEIRDELHGEFKIEQERTVHLNEKGVRELFHIPYEVPDPNPPIEAPVSFTEPPVATPTPSEDGLSDAPPPPPPLDEPTKVAPPQVKTIPVAVPLEILGDTHIMLLEAIGLKKAMKEAKRPSLTTPLQFADERLQIKVGPVVFTDAVALAPNSFHAIYGRREYVPGAWCPRLYDDKRYVMINFFPRFVTELLSPPPDSETLDNAASDFEAELETADAERELGTSAQADSESPTENAPVAHIDSEAIRADAEA